MEKTVFDFQDYKDYLTAVIEDRSQAGRGFRSLLAEAAGVQLAFLYQVLKKKTHFNLEHADRINEFLEHSNEEAHFFLLLVQYGRAGTERLREYFRTQMKVAINQRLVLKNRLKTESSELSPEDKARYYSAWYYGAIRCAVAVPKLRTAEALSKRFGLSSRKTGGVLEFLTSRGLVEKKGDQYLPGARHLHLGNDSSLIAKHHTNWRVRCLSSLDEEKTKDLHYSSVVTLSQHDALELKSMLVQQIEDFLEKVKPSPEETVYSFCVDYFEL